MSYFISAPKVGRSQGASIFWGLISVCFATAACYYYWKNHENEGSATQMRDTVLQLRDENETLKSQKEHLQATKTEEDSQLKTREDLVQQKETELAAEETRLEGLGRQSQVQMQQNQAQVAVVKKFNDAISKVGKELNTDVVNRAGRPVLRIPNADLFAPGDTTLKPEGKALLSQLSQALIGQLDTFELRVVAYTDTDAEGQASGQKKDGDAKSTPAPSWDLTSARTSTLARFYRDQTPLPFRNVIVMARGDSDPVVANSQDDRTRNRRVEITVNPLPVPFRAPEPEKTPVANPTAANDSQASTTATPAPAKKEKPKDKNSSR